MIRLRVPELRERREDIPLLVDRFLARFNAITHRAIERVSTEAMACLMAYDYPGNVRELENAIEHAFVLCQGAVIAPEHLPPAVSSGGSACAQCGGGLASLKQLEASVLLDTLTRHEGNRAASARELGVHRSTLFRKIKALGLHAPRRRGEPSRR